MTTSTADRIVTCITCRQRFFRAFPSKMQTECKNCDPASHTRYTPRSPATSPRIVATAVAPTPSFAWLAHPYWTGIGVISATLLAIASIWIALSA